ncbi:unnamed protein product [Brassica rapa subsp. trilocularis]
MLLCFVFPNVQKKTAVWTIILQPHDMYCHSCNRCRHVILRLFERLLMELGFRIAVFVVFDSASNLRWLSQIRQKQLYCFRLNNDI